MNKSLFTCVRTYATKSKTTNLKYKFSVPVEQTTLSDGSVMFARQPVVAPHVQATSTPLLKQSVTKSTLTESQISEIRQLRQSDPEQWTRSKLAKKFNCSELFVGMVAPTGVKNVQQMASQGYRRRLIKQERQMRKALW
jgi:hypothetical protein